MLWLLSHYRQADVVMNCPMICRFLGDLDVGALSRALTALTARHEGLRTTFAGRGRDLRQYIHPPRELPLIRSDLTGTPDPELALHAAIQDDVRTNVDAARWPVRATLWRVSDRNHVLCLNMHHLITDSWSCGILLNEALALLGGASVSALPPVEWQYADFVRWQSEQLSGESAHRHIEYWRQQLRDAELPAYPLQPVPSAETRVVAADVRAAVADRLRALARAQRTTFFTVLLALYYARLYQVTGQRDLAIASIYANRFHPSSQRTIGFMANQVVLRTAFDPAQSFTELLRSTHHTVTGAFVHQGVPLQMLPPHTLPTEPARADDLVFQLVAEPQYPRSVGSVDVEVMLPETVTRRFEVEFAIMPKSVDSGVRAVLFHRAGRLDDQWASEFVRGYADLAELVSRAPQNTLGTLTGSAAPA
jgi:hypothetical protein